MLSNSPVTASLPFKGLKKAQDFYSNKLGLRRTAGSADDGFLEFAAGDGTTLVLFESDSRKSNDTAASFDVENLAQEMTALRRKGVEFEEYDLPEIRTVDGVATMGPHRMAWFKDPGGNLLGLHQRESRARRASGEPRGQRQRGEELDGRAIRRSSRGATRSTPYAHARSRRRG